MADLSSFDVYPVNLVKDNTSPLYEITSRFSGAVSFPIGSRVAMNSLSIYYSWRNMTTAFNNTTLSYTDTDAKEHTVTFPEGYYNITDINGYLHYVMKANGHYLLDGDSNEVYYISIVENPIYNRFTVTCDPVPSALPSGYTNPASWSLPVSNTTMLLNIPATNIRELLGFNAQSIPAVAQSSQYQKNSDNVPQIAPITSVYLHSPLVNNSYLNPSMSDVLYTFSPASDYASFLNITPNNLVWSPCHNTYFNDITVRFTDQLGRDLQILDYQYQLNLLIAVPKNIKK